MIRGMLGRVVFVFFFEIPLFVTNDMPRMKVFYSLESLNRDREEGIEAIPSHDGSFL